MKAAMKKGPRKEGGEEGHRGRDGEATVPAKKAVKKVTAKKAVKKVTMAEMAKQLSAIHVGVNDLAVQLSCLNSEALSLTRLVKNPRHPAGVPPPRPSPRRLALPRPWEEHYSDVYKRPYYWNVETGNSVWLPPA